MSPWREPIAGAEDHLGVECLDPKRTATMPLSPGTRLGHYDGTALLGEGGNGGGQAMVSTDYLFSHARSPSRHLRGPEKSETVIVVSILLSQRTIQAFWPNAPDQVRQMLALRITKFHKVPLMQLQPNHIVNLSCWKFERIDQSHQSDLPR